MALASSTEPLVTPESPKFCKNCAHLIGVRTALEYFAAWKCGAKENEKGINLVTGEKTYKIILCEDMRSRIEDNTCGPQGRWFQQYEYPKPGQVVPVSPKAKLSSLTLDDI